MIYRLLSIVLAAAFPGGASAEVVQSAYTELDEGQDCAVFSGGSQNEAHWADLVCSGYKGYPILIYYSDARESLFYGFPPSGERAPVWESFASFNRAGQTVEWRIAMEGSREIPFATIHRWFVEDPDRAKPVEVLVVEKVGRIGEWQGCAVGYVVATGNANANAEARRIADEKARTFACGKDKPVKIEDAVRLPLLSTEE